MDENSDWFNFSRYRMNLSEKSSRLEAGAENAIIWIENKINDMLFKNALSESYVYKTRSNARSKMKAACCREGVKGNWPEKKIHRVGWYGTL